MNLPNLESILYYPRFKNSESRINLVFSVLYTSLVYTSVTHQNFQIGLIQSISRVKVLTYAWQR